MRLLPLFALLPALAAAQAPLPEAPRPFSLDLNVEQRYRMTTGTLTNPVGASLTYRTPYNSIRVGLGYSFTPQTGDQAVALSLRYRVLQFGHRRR